MAGNASAGSAFHLAVSLNTKSKCRKRYALEHEADKLDRIAGHGIR
jgi:hypothetical protein